MPKIFQKNFGLDMKMKKVWYLVFLFWLKIYLMWEKEVGTDALKRITWNLIQIHLKIHLKEGYS